MEWVDMGYWGLFLACFFAATIIPFSSETVLAAMLLGPFDPVYCLFVATAGNWLGGMSGYGLGWMGNWHRITRWLRVKEQAVMKTKKYIHRYGPWTALFCWLPVVGDALAIALGLFRVTWWKVTVLMLVGKFLRFVVTIYLITTIWDVVL